MPAVEVRPATNSDLNLILSMDLGYLSPRVWQMERLNGEGQMGVRFNEVRLPREARIEYPRTAGQILDESIPEKQVILTASSEGQLVGFARIADHIFPKTAWIKDCVVNEPARRRGIGTALLVGVQEWALERNFRRLTMELQSKNYPGVQLAQKMGYAFAGYSDHYYMNQDIALFFTLSLR
ncbi:MAG: GNAT family N-acetyltransferase [Anaerolineaceae bacterium]|nr:GNAT family N-acetyltransferase [Anaerolineaceae bacterium]